MTEIAKFQNSLEAYTIRNSLRLFNKVRSPIEAFKTECKSLAIIKKDEGEEKAIDLIIVWLISLNEFVNFSRKMGESQIEEVAIYILQDYYYFKMSDIYLIITMIKKGEFGQLYESLDGVKILGFFEKYAKDRANLIFQENLIEHDKTKYI